MGKNSRIEWTDDTTNPVRARNLATGKVGSHCTHASPGCINCYAEAMNRWVGTGLAYLPANADKVEIYLDEAALVAPLTWRKPLKIFLGSMTDIFGEFVTRPMIVKMLAVCALTPQHEWQLLTKRTERMQRELMREGLYGDILLAMEAIARENPELIADDERSRISEAGANMKSWPLPNVLVGTSVEDQRRADERRRPMLQLATDEWRTWVSYEPALERVDWRGWQFLDWMVSGDESGRRARPGPTGAHQAARDFCALYDIPYFFKQHGEWITAERLTADGQPFWQFADGEQLEVISDHLDMIVDDAEQHRGTPKRIWREYWATGDGRLAKRPGKKQSGRLLDGREHSEFPKVAE